MILPERKVWALYRKVSELLLSPKEGWRSIKWKLYVKVQRPEKQESSWEESLSSLPEGEWAVAESQRGMTQDEVKIVCQGATPWRTSIFLIGRVELFTGGWVRCCWVPKRDDAGNEKNPSKHLNVVSTLLLGWYDVAMSHNVKSTLKQHCVRQSWNLQHLTTLKQSCVFQSWNEQR